MELLTILKDNDILSLGMVNMSKKNKAIIIVSLEIIGIIILYCFIKSDYMQYIPKCWIYESTGILCPACGGTRLVQFLSKGMLWEAFCANSILFLFGLYLLFANIVFICQQFTDKNIFKNWKFKYWHVIIFSIIWLVYTIFRNIL